MIKTEMTFVCGKSSNDFKVMYDCALCRYPFQFGPAIYRGQPVNAWDIMCCSTCISANHDGIVPSSHPDLVEHLTAKGITIKYNKHGWIEWPEGHGLRF